MPYWLSALAERDLDEIWFYVAEDASFETADRLIDAIFDRLDLLVEQPRMGRSRPEFGEGVRSFVVESYVIYYRHDQDILIARVLHAVVIKLPHGPSDVRYSPPHLLTSSNESPTPRRVAVIACGDRRVGRGDIVETPERRRAEVEV